MISAKHLLTPTVVARCLTTESIAHSSLPPPLLPPKPTKPSTRTRLNPAPRPTVHHSHIPLSALPPSFGRNQLLPVPDATRALLESIVAQFDAPIRYAFAYGSGVFEQNGYAASSHPPMLDFIFAVTHTAHFHSINMHQFPGHYPLHARALGSDFVSRVQEISPGLWFNTYVPMQGVMIKYGVTTVDNLCGDLLNWRSLYLAGRMHKPLRIIKDNPRVRLTQQVNLASAVRTALLSLPAEFAPADLFARIAAISYTGDPRMRLPAENRSKVANIVQRQGAQFTELYQRLAGALPGVHWHTYARTITQDVSPQARAAHLRKLPSNLLAGVERHYAGTGLPAREDDEAVYWTKMAADENLPSVLEQEIAHIVRYPSTIQSVKGVLSAGVSKSVRYSAEKISKWWKSGREDKKA